MGFLAQESSPDWVADTVAEQGNTDSNVVILGDNTEALHADEIEEIYQGSNVLVVYWPAEVDLDSFSETKKDDNGQVYFDNAAGQILEQASDGTELVVLYSGSDALVAAKNNEKEIVDTLVANQRYESDLPQSLLASYNDIMTLTGTLTKEEIGKDYVFNSIQELKQANVVKIDNADAPRFDDVYNEFEDTTVGVVYWPDTANLDGYTTPAERLEISTAADKILDKAPENIKTVIVYSGSDAMVASDRGLEEIVGELKKNHKEGDPDMAKSLLLSSEAIQDYNEITPGDWLPVAGGITSALVALTVIPVWVTVQGNKRKERKKSEAYKLEQEAKKNAKDLKARNKLMKKQLWRQDQKRVAQAEIRKTMREPLPGLLDSIDVVNHEQIMFVDQEFSTVVDGYTDNAYAFFKRLSEIGTTRQKGLAQVEFESSMGKVHNLLKNYASIKDQPDYWENAEDKLAKIRKAVGAASREAIDNIRQLNASQDLVFEADVAQLSALSNENTL